MAKEYKRKFLVPGDTIKRCSDFSRKCQKKYGSFSYFRRPCYPTARGVDLKLCPYPIGKPSEYIVSETEEDKWECSCPVWKFKRRRCHHIVKAQANPEKYEISKNFTGKTADVLKRLTEIEEGK